MTPVAAPRRGGVAGFGVFTLVMVTVFIGLGVWQLQRRVEKHVLIAALTERLAAAPQALPSPAQWSALTPEQDEFRRVRLTAINIDFGLGGRVYGSGSALREDISGPGKWDFVPVLLQSGEIVAVNIGFAQDPAQKNSSDEARYTRFVVRIPNELTGYIRFPEGTGILTPTANVDQRLWFARDHLAMARALGWDRDGKTIAPFYVDLESPELVPGVKPGRLTVHLKDDHMQYAITWFTLAGALVVAFGVWWRAQRRVSPSGIR
jgi:cytochrome oxidase assembly protein ShyY1